ncbi:unnamed protein product, partial [Amoebophrya sp. A25]
EAPLKSVQLAAGKAKSSGILDLLEFLQPADVAEQVRFGLSYGVGATSGKAGSLFASSGSNELSP